MNDDTDFDFDVAPASPPSEAPPTPTPARSQPAAPTHHIHTPAGSVTVVGHDVMAALIEALSEVHRRGL